MRKLLIVIAALFAITLLAAAGVNAAKTTTKHPVRYARKAHARRHAKKYRTRYVKKCKCRYVKKRVYRRKRVYRHRIVRKARPARRARGPIVTCPAPVVNVPQQAAPVVNVPQQPAPVVNVPPSSAIATDANNIYILRGNQLTVLNKCTYECIKSVTLP